MKTTAARVLFNTLAEGKEIQMRYGNKDMYYLNKHTTYPGLWVGIGPFNPELTTALANKLASICGIANVHCGHYHPMPENEATMNEIGIRYSKLDKTLVDRAISAIKDSDAYKILDEPRGKAK